MEAKSKKAAQRLEDIQNGKVEASMDEIAQAKKDALLATQNVEYWDNVVKFLEDVKKGAEAQAEEEAKAEAEAKAEENAHAEGAEEAKEDAPSQEEETNAPEANEEKGADEVKDADNKAVESEEPKPIGTGVFGNIFNQFKGKVMAAFDFLMKHKSGDLLGVFHRDDIGDIDLVWGDYNGGLGHIIRRHIEEQNDFSSVDEIRDVIDRVIANGTITKENGDKVNIEYNGYKVSIKKRVRDEKGNILENKNWVVTAFDKSKPKHEKRRSSSSETLTTPSANQKADGVTLPSNDESSTDKVTESSNTEQTSDGKNDGSVQQVDNFEVTRINYTDKKGKTTERYKLKLYGKINGEQRDALEKFANERMGEGPFSPKRGIYDEERGCFVFRTEEDARKAAGLVNSMSEGVDQTEVELDKLKDAKKNDILLRSIVALEQNIADMKEELAYEEGLGSNSEKRKKRIEAYKEKIARYEELLRQYKKYASPQELAWTEAKRKNPDAVVFFDDGDGMYTTYQTDADAIGSKLIWENFHYIEKEPDGKLPYHYIRLTKEQLELAKSKGTKTIVIITPEQSSLLNRPNSDQYTTEQELSDDP